MQLLTFLSEVDNIVLIGDTSAKIGERNVVDVYTDLYAKTRKKLGIVEVGGEDEPFKRTIKKEDVNAFKNQGQGKRVISGQDVSTDGWQADAHKNLPGFQVLVETYPDADWYLMIDDDTYVVMDNLAQYLEAKNPNEPHFIGRNNYFKGCDGVTQFHTGPGAGTAEHPYIAQGGSGIIISRGAMKKMTKGLNQCIIKYQNCWAGDIRTALCLRDNGVVVSWGDGFYENPPLDEIRFPDDPCSLPNTFHHVLPSQMQTLYEVERENWNFRGTLTTTMDRIFAAFHSSESFVEKDTNRPDGDIEVHNDVETADKCQNLCTKVQFCLAWTFDDIGGHCRLKNRLGEPKSGLKGYTSGVIGGRYTCKGV
ncbi:hypothetical protein HDU79_009008 [Rhizoclosmatium sp. JEL0117]|nr:hypothetical protein HDU79_009008 [Rhizoclosmatium sp. JEL0117]